MNAYELDAKWTAYALGEMDARDVPALQELLRSNALLREHVEQVQSLVPVMREALGVSDVPEQLDAKRQALILQAALVASPSLVAKPPRTVRLDLRARLGKASSIASTDSARVVPPPPLVSGGIEAPSKAPQRPGTEGPFQAVAAADPVPEIRVEVGQEVIAAQKRGVLRVLVAASISGVVGLGLGWSVGSLQTRSVSNDTAISDARSLIDPVQMSAGQVEALDETLIRATKSIYQDKKFPEGLSKDLSRLEVSFSAAEFGGRSLHRLPRALMRMLFDYARDAQELNARKERLSRLFDARGEQVRALVEQSSAPKIGYSVVIQRDRRGNAVGTFVTIEKPWRFESKSWPSDVLLNTGKEVVAAKRYQSGDPFDAGKGTRTLVAVPLEPDSVAAAFPSPLGARIEEELKAMQELIHGSQPGTVALEDEKPGLRKMAEEIVRELNTIGVKR